jgi:peptide/nickel transport system substrate-binding protein
MVKQPPPLTRREFSRLGSGLAGGYLWPFMSYAQSVSDPPQRSRHGTITLLVDPEPATLVTLTDPGDPSMAVSAKVTEGLLCYDFDMNPMPQLAISWAVDENAQVFTFNLRPGVKWHDGVDFTSADVAFSILLLKQVHPRGRATFSNVVEVSTPSEHQAIIRVARPAPYLLYALAASESPIVARHIYEGTDARTNPNGSAPIGTGPFLFREWIKGERIIYTRNPDYWDKAKPWLDEIVVRIIPDSGNRLASVLSGQIDLAPATPVPLRSIARIEKDDRLGIEENGYQYTNQVVRLEFNTDHPVLKLLPVRQAIAHAIDRNALIEAAWYGYAVPVYGPISPQLKRFFSDEIVGYEFDPAKSESLLDEAGFRRGPDGMRFSLVEDYIPAGDGYRATAEYVAGALKQIGISVTVRTQEFRAYVKRIYTDRDFAFSTNRANNMFDPTIGVQRLFWSKNFRIGVPFSNGSHFENPEADALLETAATEADPELRRNLFVRFQQLIVRELPDLTLLAPKQVTIFNRRVSGHTITADGICGNLADAYLVDPP